MKKEFPCPCCGYVTFSGPPGTFETCPVCFWTDDDLQLAYPNLVGGANKVSLIEGQRNFRNFGASEKRLLEYVKKPTSEYIKCSEWRILDEINDKYLDWNNKKRDELWMQNKIWN